MRAIYFLTPADLLLLLLVLVVSLVLLYWTSLCFTSLLGSIRRGSEEWPTTRNDDGVGNEEWECKCVKTNINVVEMEINTV